MSETGQEDRIMFLMISVLKHNFLFMIFPLTHVLLLHTFSLRTTGGGASSCLILSLDLLKK